jgi:hypothetical protein
MNLIGRTASEVDPELLVGMALEQRDTGENLGVVSDYLPERRQVQLADGTYVNNLYLNKCLIVPLLCEFYENAHGNEGYCINGSPNANAKRCSNFENCTDYLSRMGELSS